MHLLAHQREALTSPKKEVFLAGGVGAGKTMIGSLWALKKVMQTPAEVYGLIVSNTYNQLYDTTIRAFYQLLTESKISTNPRNLPRGKGPADLMVHNGSHWVRILLRSLEHYERLSGLEVGWYWADEVWQTKQEAIDILNARLRDRKMERPQALFTTTLDDPSTWMYTRFVENYEPDLQQVIYAKTEANPYLPDGYLQTLKATYSEATFKRMVLAEWVALDSEKIYTSFNRELHVGPCELEPNLPLFWSHDFNIGYGKPMSSIILQYHAKADLFCVLDEIILDRSDTNDAVTEFQYRYRNFPEVIVYGDATGNARDTRSKVTDYEILAKAGFQNQKVPRANPPIRERHNVVNALLQDANGTTRIRIDPKCRTLIKGLDTTKLKKGSGYIEDDSTREQHVTTALGYCLCQERPNRSPQLKQFRAQGL